MGLADLHIHTHYSVDGLFSPQAVLEHVAAKTDLNVIAITDHDTLDGALRAEEMAAGFGVEVIPGCEISTAEGHLLGLFIRERVPAGLSLVETIFRVGELGGVCIAPHPLAYNAKGLSEISIRNAFRDAEARKILSGIEVYNASLIYRASNALAGPLADKYGMARVGSSDSHLLWTIGKGATAFVGRTGRDLRTALTAGATAVIKNGFFHPARLISDWAGLMMLKHLGQKSF